MALQTNKNDSVKLMLVNSYPNSNNSKISLHSCKPLKLIENV